MRVLPGRVFDKGAGTNDVHRENSDGLVSPQKSVGFACGGLKIGKQTGLVALNSLLCTHLKVLIAWLLANFMPKLNKKLHGPSKV